MLIFTDSFPDIESEDLHVIVDSSFANNFDLINYIERATFSPYCDGDNWDGFFDSITDFTWLKTVKNIRIIHKSLPNIKDIHKYLDLLNFADVWWEINPEREENCRHCIRDFVNYYSQKDMEFNVFFRNEDKEFVTNSLENYSKNYRERLYYDCHGIISIEI